MGISLRTYLHILARYLAHQKGRFAELTILVLLSIGLQIVNPQIMRFFIDAASAGRSLNELLVAAIGFLVAALVQQAVSVGATYQGEYVAWSATNALREDLAAHSLSLDMQVHNDKSPGEFIERIETDATNFSNFFSQLAVRIAGNLLLLVGIVVALIIVNPLLGAAFFAFIVLALTALALVRGIAVPHQKAQREAETELFAFLEERLVGTEDIRSCGAVNFVINRLYRLHSVILDKWWKASLMGLGISATGGLMMMAGYGLAFLSGYVLYQRGLISLGTAYLILHYTNLLSRPVRELTRQVESLQNIGATVERMEELFSMSSSIPDGPGAPIPAGEPLSLEFQNVSFSYTEGKPVLNSVSLYLPAGRVLGLLGQTGGGKTTIARLLFRLYDPSEGSIRLGGVDIREAKIAELRQRVAYVTQDVQLFQASVRDNITFFDRSIPDDRILEVIESLGLMDWYRTLPAGLDTRLQSGGRSLSAGEAQLLALTRVFLRNPGLVIMDEASSRLDPATERLVEHVLDRLLAGRTAVIIAHRLGTVNRSDDILIIDGGENVEFGDRLELLARPTSRFYRLRQAGLEELLA
ncbi:MAG: ABC transporter ATP-binding protein [Firmicutes bacterium]|nr:ABC transporter ATP-binding protein [Bacillota bacterium]